MKLLSICLVLGLLTTPMFTAYAKQPKQPPRTTTDTSWKGPVCGDIVGYDDISLRDHLDDHEWEGWAGPTDEEGFSTLLLPDQRLTVSGRSATVDVVVYLSDNRVQAIELRCTKLAEEVGNVYTIQSWANEIAKTMLRKYGEGSGGSYGYEPLYSYAWCDEEGDRAAVRSAYFELYVDYYTSEFRDKMMSLHKDTSDKL